MQINWLEELIQKKNKMVILTLNKKELEKKIGKITPEVEENISMMGTPVEEVTENEFSVEIFPNRPDLLSAPNFARAVNQFLGKKKITEFKINKPERNYTITVDKSVKKVWPYAVCAIVRGLEFNNEKIKDIVDLQEKITGSIGRKRKKLGLGVYPLDKIKLPIRYLAKKPEEISFLPLEARKEMNGRQILRGHPTGREYAHLLEGAEVFPIFIDAEDKILSMPPIINSEETGRITEETKDIFIECTGPNLYYLKKAMNIMISSLSEIGGEIYSMNIRDPEEGLFSSPEMNSEEIEFNIEDIEKTLGIKLTEKEVKKYLERMGIGYEKRKKRSIALIPAYRVDILHWVDLVEEVAIAYGYNNFEPEIPEISTIAEEDPIEKTKRVISNILVGLGLLEVSSFHLTTKKNIKKMHFDYKEFIEVEDSKTERDVLRMDILTNLLQILSENSDSTYPQKIFEIGTVFSRSNSKETETGIKESERLAISLIDESINFTELKQILDYLFKMLDKKYILESVEDSNYILGRVGVIKVDDQEIGRIGEIAPRVLKNWKIKMPIVALEIDLGFLF